MSFNLQLHECVSPLNAKMLGESVALLGVSINTRTLKPGELYVAIAGDRFNGHDFVKAAEEAGAAAILVQENVVSDLPQLMVADTQAALGQLGRFWAARFGIPTIAITGSNGKTTVKEIIASILAQQGPVLATKGNLNNELGVPLTLLGMRSEHIYAVIEMGANHAGEIARLVDLAKPDVALVTNIGTAHLEGFGSVPGIAAAKSEIFAGLNSDGFGVINADDAFADDLRAACAHCCTLEFGFNTHADVRCITEQPLCIEWRGDKISPRFRLSGKHNIANALAAIAAVRCLDVQGDSIVRGLEAMTPVPGRLERKSGLNGAVIIDDSYNANPESVQSAVKVLAACGGKRFLVLGDMAELGSDELEMHRLVGEFAAQQKLDGLWTVGELTKESNKAFTDSLVTSEQATLALHFADQPALIDSLSKKIGNGVTVLVKGSRSARMERVVNAILGEMPTLKQTSNAGGSL